MPLANDDDSATLSQAKGSKQLWDCFTREVARRGWGGLDDQGLAMVASSFASSGVTLSEELMQGTPRPTPLYICICICNPKP